jgi:penicillin V acylase-like amidase (Ntn superfamily)
MCSRILWQGRDGKPVIIGRNMDWFEDMRSNMWVLPRGMGRDGLATANPLTWTSRYGSLIMTAYDIGVADGLNEAGLDGNILFLAESDYGERDVSVPGVSLSLWLQYFLDNFATVGEAVDHVGKHPVQVRPVTAGISQKTPIRVHLSLADQTGDNAIIEYIDGRQVVYHDHKYRVMTNSPPFDEQLDRLKWYKGFSGDKDLPGSTKAADRFVRAAYYLRHLPEPENSRAAIAGVLSVMRNVSQPFGTADPDEPNTSPTIWRTVTDLTDGLYFYESTTSPFIIWADTGKIDFSAGSGVRKLNLAHRPDRLGDVTAQFELAALFSPAAPDREHGPVAEMAQS